MSPRFRIERVLLTSLLTVLGAIGSPRAGTVEAIEYFHADFGHYFMTTFPQEAAALDAGTINGWKRTGFSFPVSDSAGADLSPVCRFFSTTFAPKSSHFYTPSADECASLKQNANWQFEANAFYARVPDASGTCPPDTARVYRLYNNGQGAAPNHRYTISASIRADMVARGWIPEGQGPDGVAFCTDSHSLPIGGADIASWATVDITGRLSVAGTWLAVESPNAGPVPFWNVVRLGPAQRQGLALAGWAFHGAFGGDDKDVTPVRAFVLEQQADGTLQEATQRILGDPVTNGAGEVLVADFNGDGFDDLVLTAHNESPFLRKSSTAYMSNADGTLTKRVLSDSVMDHDARIVMLEGKRKIIARSFGEAVRGDGGNNLVYEWTGNDFAIDLRLGDVGGMSVLAGKFTGGNDDWIIIGDSGGGFQGGFGYDPKNPMQNYAYRYSNGVTQLPPTLLPKPYFNDKPEYASFPSQWDPYSKSHTSRLWINDFNQDGLPDILAFEEIWSTSGGFQKSVYQMLQNRGGLVFTDETDTLLPEYGKDSLSDYSARFVDVDGSGIDTIFLSTPQSGDESQDSKRQGNYILVNDGTGRFYAAMHEEFRAMRTQIHEFLLSKAPNGSFYDDTTPWFMAYQAASGLLNFVAALRGPEPVMQRLTFTFVNVPLGINLTTDFRRDITVARRNGSKRIRTFAGNDTIYRAISDPDCSIDGGLGDNAVVYPGPRSDWTITRIANNVQIRPAKTAGGVDTLTRIQKARFDDQTVDLTTY